MVVPRVPWQLRELDFDVYEYSRRPPVGRLFTSKGCLSDLVFRRFSSPIVMSKVLGISGVSGVRDVLRESSGNLPRTYFEKVLASV